MAAVDRTEWVDATGQRGTCKHYILPGFYEAIEAQDARKSLKPLGISARAPRAGHRIVGHVHGFPIVHDDRLQDFPRQTLAAEHEDLPCAFALDVFATDSVPLWSKPPSTEEDTCPRCFRAVKERLEGRSLRLRDVQWRDESGVLRRAPAALQRKEANLRPMPIPGLTNRPTDQYSKDLQKQLRRQATAIIAMDKRLRADD